MGIKVVAGLGVRGSSPDQKEKLRSFLTERDVLFCFREWGPSEALRHQRKWQTNYQPMPVKTLHRGI